MKKNKKAQLSKEYLEHKYIKENLSQRKLCQVLGISRRGLRFHLQKHQLKKSLKARLKLMEITYFKKGHQININKKRPDMIGNKFNPFKEGEKHLKWKGDKVGYGALHEWVRNHKPKPDICPYCKERHPKEIALIGSEHKRDINCYEWLCVKCHRILDGNIKNLKGYNEIKV